MTNGRFNTCVYESIVLPRACAEMRTPSDTRLTFSIQILRVATRAWPTWVHRIDGTLVWRTRLWKGTSAFSTFLLSVL